VAAEYPMWRPQSVAQAQQQGASMPGASGTVPRAGLEASDKWLGQDGVSLNVMIWQRDGSGDESRAHGVQSALFPCTAHASARHHSAHNLSCLRMQVSTLARVYAFLLEGKEMKWSDVEARALAPHSK